MACLGRPPRFRGRPESDESRSVTNRCGDRSEDEPGPQGRWLSEAPREHDDDDGKTPNQDELPDGWLRPEAPEKEQVYPDQERHEDQDPLADTPGHARHGRVPIQLGSLWPAAERLQPYSLFYYLKAKAILTGFAAPFDVVVLSSVILIAMIWALVVFPRRDLAAPS